VLEPDFFGAVDVDTGRSILFMPRLPIEYGTWLGDIETTDECKERYDHSARLSRKRSRFFVHFSEVNSAEIFSP
jgi:hypothetical protein